MHKTLYKEGKKELRDFIQSCDRSDQLAPFGKLGAALLRDIDNKKYTEASEEAIQEIFGLLIDGLERMGDLYSIDSISDFKCRSEHEDRAKRSFTLAFFLRELFKELQPDFSTFCIPTEDDIRLYGLVDDEDWWKRRDTPTGMMEVSPEKVSVGPKKRSN